MQLRMAVSVAVYVLMIAACGGDDGASLDPMSPVPPAITATSPTSVGSSTTATRPSTTWTEPMMIAEGEVRARDGQALPDSGTVVITWVVSAGPEDYVFVYGMGTQRGAEFVVQLDAPPPAEALNNATLGVGVVLLVPEDADVPEGRLGALAQVGQHAVPRFEDRGDRDGAHAPDEVQAREHERVRRGRGEAQASRALAISAASAAPSSSLPGRHWIPRPCSPWRGMMWKCTWKTAW